MIAIVVSRADSASEHIGERLLDLADWTDHADSSRPDADGGGLVRRLDATAVADVAGGTGADAGSAVGRDGDAASEPAFELRTFDAMHLDLDRPADAFGRVDADGSGSDAGAEGAGVGGDDGADRTDPDLLLFVSRHSGDTGPLLTCHFTGNFGPAEYGGTDGELARACPNAQKRLVAAFDEHAPAGYAVAIEGTHHGPSEVGAPSMFVELGSGESEWRDPEGAEAVARAVLDLAGVAADVRDGTAGGDDPRHLVGFGGGHYAPRFERVLRETAWGVGHVAADWQLTELGTPAEHPDVLRRTFERSAADRALVEGEKTELRATLADLGYRVVSETWVRAVDDRPIALVDALEAKLGSVEDGLRFGERVPPVEDLDDPSEAYAVRSFPEGLLSEAQGVDADATRRAVEERAVAFWTEQSGTRAVGRVALPSDDAGASFDGLVEALADVLATKYESVTVADDAVVARETAFVPATARELGVPEGPEFGKLADGEAVEVDGRTVRPADVRTERKRRFPV